VDTEKKAITTINNRVTFAPDQANYNLGVSGLT
jgi:hypothetical protein